MPSAEITVTGKGDVRIPLLGRPHHVEVHFVKEPVWVPCNHHHHHDKLEWFIDHEDEDRRHHGEPGHIHHDRRFVLFIEWEVSGVETIHYSVTY